jgi:hypothetical protein
MIKKRFLFEDEVQVLDDMQQVGHLELVFSPNTPSEVFNDVGAQLLDLFAKGKYSLKRVDIVIKIPDMEQINPVIDAIGKFRTRPELHVSNDVELMDPYEWISLGYISKLVLDKRLMHSLVYMGHRLDNVMEIESHDGKKVFDDIDVAQFLLNKAKVEKVFDYPYMCSQLAPILRRNRETTTQYQIICALTMLTAKKVYGVRSTNLVYIIIDMLSPKDWKPIKHNKRLCYDVATAYRHVQFAQQAVVSAEREVEKTRDNIIKASDFILKGYETKRKKLIEEIASIESDIDELTNTFNETCQKNMKKRFCK